MACAENVENDSCTDWSAILCVRKSAFSPWTMEPGTAEGPLEKNVLGVTTLGDESVPEVHKVLKEEVGVG